MFRLNNQNGNIIRYKKVYKFSIGGEEISENNM